MPTLIYSGNAAAIHVPTGVTLEPGENDLGPNEYRAIINDDAMSSLVKPAAPKREAHRVTVPVESIKPPVAKKPAKRVRFKKAPKPTPKPAPKPAQKKGGKR